MLFKFLWILVIVWIAYRVFVAGRSLVRLALGRDEAPLPGGPHDPSRSADRPPERQEPGRDGERSRSAADVEDARWVDL
jgi:hypothetical protein